jgi:hypothetical protein
MPSGFSSLFGHTNAKIMDGGRIKWVKEGRELTRRSPVLPPSEYTAPARDDSMFRAFREEVLNHIEAHKPLVDVRSPEEFRGERLHMPDYPNEGRCAAGISPARRAFPGPRGQSRRRHLQAGRRAAGPLCEGKRPQARTMTSSPIAASASAAATPGSCCAICSATTGEELRRKLDGMGEHGRRADRETVSATTATSRRSWPRCSR